MNRRKKNNKLSTYPINYMPPMDQYGFGSWLKKNAGMIGGAVGAGVGTLIAPGIGTSIGASLGSSLGGGTEKAFAQKQSG